MGAPSLSQRLKDTEESMSVRERVLLTRDSVTRTKKSEERKRLDCQRSCRQHEEVSGVP
jgi:hypothetical protein